MDRCLHELAAEYITGSFHVILNGSLVKGKVFDDLQIAPVTPVYKRDGNVNSEN